MRTDGVGGDLSDLLVQAEDGRLVRYPEWEKTASMVDQLSRLGSMHEGAKGAHADMVAKRDRAATAFQEAAEAANRQRAFVLELERKLLAAAYGRVGESREADE